MNAVIFPTKLLENGVDAAKIGFAASFEIVSGLLMLMLLTALIKKIGIKKSILFSSIIYSSIVFLVFFCNSFYLWLFFVVIIGNCWVINAIIRQSMLNSLLNSENRGFILGVYSMIMALAIMIGPIIVKFLGAKSQISFLVSASFIILSFFAIKFSKNDKKLEINSNKIKILAFFKKNPRCFVGRFCCDFILFSIIAFTVIFGKEMGLTSENAGLLIAAFMASFFADLFVGALLKKHGPYKLIKFGFAGFLVAIIIIGISKSYSLMLLMFFSMGVCAALVFISIITTINNESKKEELIATNSTMQIVGSSGSLVAGLLNGLLIHIFSYFGFIIAISLSCIIYLTFSTLYEERKNKVRR